MKKFFIVTISLFMSLTVLITGVRAEDHVSPDIPRMYGYPYFSYLEQGYVDYGWTNTHFGVRFTNDPGGLSLGCHSENWRTGATVPSAWYFDEKSCMLLLQELNGWELYKNNQRHYSDVPLWHGYENVTPRGDGSYNAVYVVVDSLAAGRGYLIKQDVVWRPDVGMGIVTKNTEYTDLTYHYEKPPTPGQITHYSPRVHGHTPYPSSSTTGNNTGGISSPVATNSVNLGAVVPTRPNYSVVGAYTGTTLTYVTGTSTTTIYTYTASRDISGASSITNGSTYNGIGSGTISWSVRDYQADVTNFTERIIVTTTGAPDINIYFPGPDKTPYDYRWMSTDTSADADRQGGLDVQASSTINGNYDLSTFISGSKERTDAVNKANTNTDPVTNSVILGWSIVDSTTAGIPATSQAFVLNDPNTSLSGISEPKRMYFDSTRPTITEVVTTDNWETITTDAQDEANGSGIGGSGTHDVGDVYFKFVPKGQTTDITTPTDGSDWTPIADYEATFAALVEGEYDLYVYAKDNATNRSNAILANTDDPIIVDEGPKVATITIKKTVVGPKGDDDDIFLINLNDNSTNALITSVALTDGETSSSLTLDIGSGPSKTIKLSEIIPMDYKSGFKYNVTKKAGDQTTISGNTITIFPGDTIRIEVENTFEPTGYFKAKDFVKNIFKS